MDDREYLGFFTDFKKFTTSRTFDNRKRKKEFGMTREPLNNGEHRIQRIKANSWLTVQASGEMPSSDEAAKLMKSHSVWNSIRKFVLQIFLG